MLDEPMVKVLLVAFFVVYLIYLCCRRRDRRDAERGPAQRVARVAESDGAVRAAESRGSVSVQVEPTASAASPQDDGEREKRTELAKAHLFSRKLDEGDSVRTIQSILDASRDRGDRERRDRKDADEKAEADDNAFVLSWRSVASSAMAVMRPPECSICLDRYEAGQTISWSKSNDCDHIFHEACILEWLAANHDECPLCRTDLISFEPPNNW